MQLTKFRVCNFRNVHDSGWIEVDRLTAFVGQNEAGKSNLCEALYLLNPYDEKNCNIDEDWPADDWGHKDGHALVCQATFRLSDPKEISTLYAAVELSALPPFAAGQTEPLSTGLPSALDLIVSRYYDQHREFEIEGVGALDQTKAETWAEANLQKCVYIKDYDLPGSRAELPDLAKRRQVTGSRLSADEELMLIVLDLAKVDVDDFLRKADTPDGRTLRSFDKRLASKFLSDQFAKLWKNQREVRFEIEIDGPTLNIFVEDVGFGMPIRLHRRSTGFRWYVAFAWKFTHATKGAYKNCILLLEEPGIHLHYSAHKSLLATLDQLAGTNTIIYTTHLATMLDPGFPERVRIVEIDQQHTRVVRGIVSTQRMPMMVIEACLGLTGETSSLLGNRQTLIVERGADALILHKLSAVLTNSGLPGLSERIYLWPADGVSKTPMFAGFLVGNKFDGGVLLAGDSEGNAAREKINELYLKDLGAGTRFRVFVLGEVAGLPNNEAAIEDIFSEFYLECVMRAYRVVIMPDDLAKLSSPQIAKRVDHVLKTRYARSGLDKGLVMGEMMRIFARWRKVEDLPEGVAERAAKLFSTINREFA
jgi:AAA ATPase domain